MSSAHERERELFTLQPLEEAFKALGFDPTGLGEGDKKEGDKK